MSKTIPDEIQIKHGRDTVLLADIQIPDGWKVAETIEACADGAGAYAEQTPQVSRHLVHQGQKVRDLWHLANSLKAHIEEAQKPAPSKEELYAQILELERHVIFGTEDEFTEIFESTEGGWVVNTFKAHDDGQRYDETDGGLCTGSALDAVQFFNVPTVPEDTRKEYDIEIEHTATFKTYVLAKDEEHAREIADELSGNTTELCDKVQPEYDTHITVERK